MVLMRKLKLFIKGICLSMCYADSYTATDTDFKSGDLKYRVSSKVKFSNATDTTIWSSPDDRK